MSTRNGKSYQSTMTDIESAPGSDPRAQWMEATKRFDYQLAETVGVLAASDREAIAPLLEYFDAAQDHISVLAEKYTPEAPPEQQEIMKLYLKKLPRVVLAVRAKLARLRDRNEAGILDFKALQYQSYENMMRNLKADEPKPGTSSAATRIFERRGSITLEEIRPRSGRRGVPQEIERSTNIRERNIDTRRRSHTPRRRRRNYSRERSYTPPRHRRRHRRHSSTSSESSVRDRDRNSSSSSSHYSPVERLQRNGRRLNPYEEDRETQDYLTHELRRELMRYRELPPPWNRAPTLCLRRDRIDIGRQIQLVSTRPFSGKLEDYVAWRDFFIANIGEIRCRAQFKVAAFQQSLGNVWDDIIKYAASDFRGYKDIVVTLESYFGGSFRHIRYLDDYFEKPEKVKYSDLKAFQEYTRKINAYRTLFADMGNKEVLRLQVTYKRLLWPLPPPYIREYHAWLDIRGDRENVETLMRWTQHRVKRLIQEQELAPKKLSMSKTVKPVHGVVKTFVNELEQNEPKIEEPESSSEEELPHLTYVKSSPPTICMLACPECHPLALCPRFAETNAKTRRQLLRNWRLMVCFRCLKVGHSVRACRERTRCEYCQAEGHHSSLHLDNSTPMVQSREISLHVGVEVASIMLPFLQIKISNKSGQSISGYAVIDTGSSLSIVSKVVATQLQCKSDGPFQLRLNTANGIANRVATPVYFLLSDLHSSDNMQAVSAYVLDDEDEMLNSMRVPDVNRILKDWNHLREVPRFEKICNPNVILLIGNDLPGLTSPFDTIVGQNMMEPVAEKSILGWSIRGPHNTGIPLRLSVNEDQGTLEEAIRNYAAAELEKKIEESWELDNKTKVTHPSTYDRLAEKMIKENLKLIDGRVHACILWKEGCSPSLPNNRFLAERRLISLQRHLKRYPEVEKLYKDNIQNWIKERVLVPADHAEPGKIYYLSHFPVSNLEKTSTKVRTVVDAAAKFKGKSLNDFIMSGPNITNDLRRVLLRFRKRKIAIMGDVKQMFTQIMLIKEEWGYQRFLWFDDKGKIVEFEYTRFPFGNACSPAIAMSAARYLVEQTDNKSRAKEAILRSTIVDDTLDSVDTIQEAITLLKNIRDIYKQGSMDFRKLCSNCVKVIRQFDSQLWVDREMVNSQDQDDGVKEDFTIKALGVQWNVTGDALQFQLDVGLGPTSKRTMLSYNAQVFDPLGLVSPLLIALKILVQELWVRKLGWDETLPVEIREKWDKTASAIKGQIEFPRYLQVTKDNEEELELHIFADASEKAYGASAYLVTKNEDIWSSCLIMSKCRLAPIKYTSIPRLELQAAVEATNLLEIVNDALQIPPSRTYFWTDSKDVVYWIASPSRNLKVFVANRVGFIQGRTWAERWNWIPSNLNPADILSRGATLTDLKTSTLWRLGPRFLCHPLERPIRENIIESQEAKKEKRKPKGHQGECKSFFPTPGFFTDYLSRFSRWKKVVQVFVKILEAGKRFKKKGKQSRSELQVEEINRIQAEITLISCLQREYFTDLFTTLLNAKPLRKTHPLANFKPFLDNESKLIRASGRLAEITHLKREVKFPIVIPENTHFATLLIRHLHQEELKHAGGVNLTIAKFKSSYAMLYTAVAVKRVLRACVICRRINFRGSNPDYAPLPIFRIPDVTTTAFQNTGLDFMGPFLTHTDRRTKGAKKNESDEKTYVLVFTCLAYRAVHLETVERLTTEDFLCAVERFVATRGRPKMILSDNGRNLVGGFNLLRKALDEGMRARLPYIRWHFTTPLDPHKNGVVERMVGLTKNHMARIMRNKKVSPVEFRTAVKCIEAILNDRPLSPMGSLVDDEPITPNHFIRGSAYNTFLLEGDISTFPVKLKKVRALLEKFHKRFMLEVVPLMNNLRKKRSKAFIFQPGQIVLIREDTLGPLSETVNFPNWPVGKIREVFPGPDGVTRSVRIEIKGRLLTRGVENIAPLFEDQETC